MEKLQRRIKYLADVEICDSENIPSLQRFTVKNNKTWQLKSDNMGLLNEFWWFVKVKMSQLIMIAALRNTMQPMIIFWEFYNKFSPEVYEIFC